MTDAEHVKLEDIWADDLLGRKAEASLLQSYLESVVESGMKRQGAGGFVLAVDAGYGEGKTFFLREFSKQLRLNHPVAYVDAWTDDLSDDPLAALVATLEDAFEPYLDRPKIKEGVQNVRNKFAPIVRALAWGLARRSVGYLVTDAVAGMLMEPNDAAADEKVKAAAGGVVDDAFGAVGSKKATHELQDRVSAFREGSQAISDLKGALSNLVNIVASSDPKVQAPIVIIIDELDRCRPDYAINLLEQVKHLFDVQGIVFVLGMHAGQLEHSVSAVYGQKFDGISYLRRFVTKSYSLKRAPRNALLKSLAKAKSLLIDRLEFYPCEVDGRDESDGWNLISAYLDAFDISVRDAERFVDALELVLALTGSAKLILPYLVPVLARNFKPPAPDPFPAWTAFGDKINYKIRNDRMETSRTINARVLAEQFHEYSRTSISVLYETQNKRGQDALLDWYLGSDSTCQRLNIQLARPLNYVELCNAVGRFSSTRGP